MNPSPKCRMNHASARSWSADTSVLIHVLKTRITDLGSCNGLRVCGRRCRQTRYQHPCELSHGAYTAFSFPALRRWLSKPVRINLPVRLSSKAVTRVSGQTQTKSLMTSATCATRTTRFQPQVIPTMATLRRLCQDQIGFMWQAWHISAPCLGNAIYARTAALASSIPKMALTSITARLPRIGCLAQLAGTPI